MLPKKTPLHFSIRPSYCIIIFLSIPDTTLLSVLCSLFSSVAKEAFEIQLLEPDICIAAAAVECSSKYQVETYFLLDYHQYYKQSDHGFISDYTSWEATAASQG
jgi:hypothetical protein